MKELNFRKSAPSCAQADGAGAERNETRSPQPKRLLVYAAAVALVAEGICSSCGSPSRQAEGGLDADVAEADIESDAHPEAGPDADTDADTDSDSDIDAAPDTGPDADDEADAEIDWDGSIDADTETDAGPDADMGVEPDADIRSDADTDAEPDSGQDADADIDVETDSGIEADADADADIDAEEDAESGGDADAEAGPDSGPDAEADAETEDPRCVLSATGEFIDVILLGAGSSQEVGTSGAEVREDSYALTSSITIDVVCTSTYEILLDRETFELGTCVEVSLVDSSDSVVGMAAVDVAYVGDDGQLIAVNIVPR